MNEKYTKLINIEVEIEIERRPGSCTIHVGDNPGTFQFNPETKRHDIRIDEALDRKAYIANSIMHRLSIVLHEYADAIHEEIHKEPVYDNEPRYVPPKVGHLPDYFTASNGVKMVLTLKTKPAEG